MKQQERTVDIFHQYPLMIAILQTLEKIETERLAIWFTPSYHQNVKTNIGKLFLKLVRKPFQKNSKYQNIFNSNTLKLSYHQTK